MGKRDVKREKCEFGRNRLLSLLVIQGMSLEFFELLPSREFSAALMNYSVEK